MSGLVLHYKQSEAVKVTREHITDIGSVFSSPFIVIVSSLHVKGFEMLQGPQRHASFLYFCVSPSLLAARSCSRYAERFPSRWWSLFSSGTLWRCNFIQPIQSNQSPPSLYLHLHSAILESRLHCIKLRGDFSEHVWHIHDFFTLFCVVISQFHYAPPYI